MPVFGTYGNLYIGKSAVQVVREWSDGWEFKPQGCQKTHYSSTDYEGSAAELLQPTLRTHSAADWILPKLTWIEMCASYMNVNVNQSEFAHQQNYRFQGFYFNIVDVDTETKAAR